MKKPHLKFSYLRNNGELTPTCMTHNFKTNIHTKVKTYFNMNHIFTKHIYGTCEIKYTIFKHVNNTLVLLC